MQLTDIPAKFNIPFASSAGGGFIRSIPQSPTGVPGQAALTTGFPPENFEPVAAGGVPPFGQDFNGLLNQSTAWNRWQGTGAAFPPYDSTFQTAVGGYPKSAIVASLVEPLLLYYSLVDNNVTNPDNGGAGWFVWFRKLTVNTTIYVNAATGNDSNNGLTPTTAKATVGAAITTAWTYPPSQFTITIQIAAGTYAGASTPSWAGPTLIINGASAASVLIDGGTTSSALAVLGPNTMTIQNLTGQNNEATPVAIFLAGNGATLNSNNTASNATLGAVFQAFGATCNPGTHTFKGNASELFVANFGGHIQIPQSVVYTIANAINVSDATASAQANGSIGVGSPSSATFVNPGNVTGKKFSCILNGTISSSGNGINYFPGSVAGTTASGGQYV